MRRNDRTERISRLPLLFLLVAFGFTACEPFTDSEHSPERSRENSLTATIDGTPWVSTSQAANSYVFAGVTPGLLEFSASRKDGATTTNLWMLLGYVSGPGTYPLGVSHYTVAGGPASVMQDSGSSSVMWETRITRVVGSVTITSLTSDRVTGTFHFDATLSDSHDPSPITARSVTDGTFDLALPPEFSPAKPPDVGNVVQATVDDSAWYAADLVVTVDIPGVHITASNNSLYLWLTIDRPIVAGATYQLQDGLRSIDAMRKGTQFWGGDAPGTSGTITITEFSDTRAAGTFQGTLGPGLGASVPIVITNGQFNVRRNH